MSIKKDIEQIDDNIPSIKFQITPSLYHIKNYYELMPIQIPRED